MRSGNIFQALDFAVDDATKMFKLSHKELMVDLWQQRFPDTSCGFGGIGGQAITTTDVVVCSHPYESRSRVYINQRFAYEVNTRDNSFQTDCLNKDLAGAVDAVKRYEIILQD
jgi:hypothetical protein